MSDPAAAARLPPHKRLANAAPGCGLSAQGLHIRANTPDLEALQAMLDSYWGHFKHANSVRLRRALFQRYPWLSILFEPVGCAARTDTAWAVRAAHPTVLRPRWVLQGETYARQADALRREWPDALQLLEKGNRWMAGWPDSLPHHDPRPLEVWGEHLRVRLATLRHKGMAYVRAAQTGWLRHGTRRREIVEWFIPAPGGIDSPASSGNGVV